MQQVGTKNSEADFKIKINRTIRLWVQTKNANSKSAKENIRDNRVEWTYLLLLSEMHHKSNM